MSWLSSSKGFPRELDCPLFCTAKSHTKLSQNFTFLTKRHSAVEMLQTRNQRSGCAWCRKMPSQESDAGRSFHIQLWNNQRRDKNKQEASSHAMSFVEFYQRFSKRTRLPTVLHSEISHKTVTKLHFPNQETLCCGNAADAQPEVWLCSVPQDAIAGTWCWQRFSHPTLKQSKLRHWKKKTRSIIARNVLIEF